MLLFCFLRKDNITLKTNQYKNAYGCSRNVREKAYVKSKLIEIVV